ncbi:hypothetical protein [Kurthia massiliensis]|uniref:hypothetical protein n=1 Tax=Kurthia massiliensis TaxID=1033739 RepID=UPI00028867B6|nr:hypothetical protein [Kurthia massiliensis]
MKNITKAIAAIALSGTIFTTTFTPVTNQSSEASAKETTISQIATVAGKTPVYAKTKDIQNKKPVIKLGANVYVKKLDTATINGEQYYLIKYDNRLAFQKGKTDKYSTKIGYVKASDMKTVAHTYGPLKKLTNYNLLPEDSFSSTKRYKLKKDTWLNESPRFDQVGKAELYEKDDIFIKTGTRDISNTPYIVANSFLEKVYVKKSLLTPDFATNVKNYSAKQQKVTYKIKSKAALRESYGIDSNLSLLSSDFKIGTKLNVVKEATYKGKRYVYVKNIDVDASNNFTQGWLLKSRITK